MAQLNLQRSSRVFLSSIDLSSGASSTSMTPRNTWELEVLSGFSATSSAATQNITILETGTTPDRSQASYNTAVNPVEWELTTYIRPTDAYNISIDGYIKPVADWFMWQSLISNTNPATGFSTWLPGGTLLSNTTGSAFKVASSTANHAIPVENHLYFQLDNVIYQVQLAVVDAATIDAGIESIATTTWRGKGRVFTELVGSNRDNAIAVFGGINNSGVTIASNSNTLVDSVTTTSAYHPYAKMASLYESHNAYIKNRLTSLEFNYQNSSDNSSTQYSFPIVSVSFDFANNDQYVTPEEISILNKPIGVFTGTRAVTGTAKTYLRAGPAESAEFLRKIAAEVRPNSSQYANATIRIGGADYPNFVLNLPAIQLDIPSIESEDILAVNIGFVAQEPTNNRGDGGEVSITALKQDPSIDKAADLFSRNIGVWYDATDISTLYQNSNGTNPVTAAGQSVAFIQDKSGNGYNAIQPTSGFRPIYTIAPKNGVRNVARGAASVDDTTYWPSSSVSSGITATKIGSGVDTEGVPYVDYRYQGVASANIFTMTYSVPSGRWAAAIGEQWVSSAKAQIIAGSLTGVNRPYVWISEENSVGVVNVAVSSTQVVAVGGPATVLSATVTLDTQDYVGIRAGLQMVSGSTIDITVRWSCLQLERGSTPTAWQANYNTYWVTEAGYPSLSFLTVDGVSDTMYTASNVNLTSYANLTALVSASQIDNTTQGILLEFSANTDTNNGTFFFKGNNGSNYWAFGAKHTNLVEVSIPYSSLAAPAPVVLDARVNTSSSNIINVRANNVLQTSANNTSLGVGTFGSHPIYLFSRGGTASFFKGRFFELMLTSASELPGTRTALDFYLMKKASVY